MIQHYAVMQPWTGYDHGDGDGVPRVTRHSVTRGTWDGVAAALRDEITRRVAALPPGSQLEVVSVDAHIENPDADARMSAFCRILAEGEAASSRVVSKDRVLVYTLWNQVGGFEKLYPEMHRYTEAMGVHEHLLGVTCCCNWHGKVVGMVWSTVPLPVPKQPLRWRKDGELSVMSFNILRDGGKSLAKCNSNLTPI